jgi:cell division protein FtsZ
MSSIARGAAKAQVDEDRPSERRDSNDLPGFLNRQNNQ